MDRLMMKLAINWARAIQFRHSNEVCGTYWTFSMLLSVIIDLATALMWRDDMAVWLMSWCCLGLAVPF